MGSRRRLVMVSRAAAAWAFGYALYRLHYALGGTWGILGAPVSQSQWIRINALAAAMLLGAAALPIVAIDGWRQRWARPFLLALAWIVTVACVGHALIAATSRVASLSGVLTIDYPFWATIDTRKADLQDLFFNEPWFLVEGVLWGAMAWLGALEDSTRRWWWVGSALAACAVATAVGLLTAFGLLERVIVG